MSGQTLERRPLCHVNLARGFRGGERQTELLIRELAAVIPGQRLIARAGQPLCTRLNDVPGLEVVPVSGKVSALRATAGVTLIHAHETAGAQVARLRQAFSGTPYIITRRVDNRPKGDWFTRSMYRHAACVVALSRAIARVLEDILPGIDCRIVPSASSHLTARPAAAEELRRRYPGKVLVGHVGAYDFSHKGQDILITAARSLLELRPQIQLVLVGAGRDEDALIALAAGLDNVLVAGWTDHVGDYLAAFDVFVFPSRHEGLGSILLDAMDFGLPIVASAVDGIPEIVTSGENGLLVPAGDSQGLAAALVRLADDAQLRSAIAARNKLKAREFSAAVMAERYLKIYRELGLPTTTAS